MSDRVLGLYALDRGLVEEFTRHTFSDGSISEALCSALEAAAHPAEPAPVVTDDAVLAAAKAKINHRWDLLSERERAVHLKRARAALEAAAPLLGPRPLLDREAVEQALDAHKVGRHVPTGSVGLAGYQSVITDAVMDLARPMPTREELAGFLHDRNQPHTWDAKHCTDACRAIYYRSADQVLALLNGGAK